MAKKISTLIVGLLLGGLLASSAPVQAQGTLQQQINRLKHRVNALEEGAKGGGDVNQEIANLKYSEQVFWNRTQKLDYNGNYTGDVGRFQVVLPQSDACNNGQPRNANWDNDHLSCTG